MRDSEKKLNGCPLKNIFEFFMVKIENFFYIQILQFIHQSKDLRNMMFLQMFNKKFITHH